MGWEQLQKIKDNNRKEASKEAQKVPTKCPVCYTSLVKYKNILFCEFCGWSG